MEHPRDCSARMNTLHHIYFDIAQDEYVNCLNVEATDTSGKHEVEKLVLSRKATEHGIKAIVFSSMCVESAINNYAGTQLGDKYAQQHLDKLNVQSKWVVIPKLVCGRSIDKSGPAFNALGKLIKARNELVHNKSKELNPTNPNLKTILEKGEQDFKIGFESSLKTLCLLRMEMDYVLGQMHNPIGTMDPAFTWIDIPDQVKGIYDKCKALVLKKYS